MFSTRLISLVAVSAMAIALAPQAALGARDDAHHLIEPGRRRSSCAGGYGPIAHEHALHVDGARLKLRRVTLIPPASARAVFSHKVTVREDGGRYRTIVNRGHQVVTYRDDCPGGGAS